MPIGARRVASSPCSRFSDSAPASMPSHMTRGGPEGGNAPSPATCSSNARVAKGVSIVRRIC